MTSHSDSTGFQYKPDSSRLVHGIDRDDFEGDANRILGLGYGYADPSPSHNPDQYYCRFCLRSMSVVESHAHFEQTGHRSLTNAALTDPSWNDRENERLAQIVQDERDRRIAEDREAEQMASDLGVVRVERPKIRLHDGRVVDAPSNHGAYDETRAELRRVLDTNPDLPLAEAQRIAIKRTMERARLRDAGIADLDDPLNDEEFEDAREREYLGASIEDLMGATSRVHAGGGAGNKTVLYKQSDGQWAMKQLMGAKSCGGGGGRSGGKLKRKKNPKQDEAA